MTTNYQELPIREEMKKAIAEMGFTEMTEIQQKAIPELLAGKEVIAKAPTGTGKTCAFGVPMVQRIQPEKGYVQGVVLCPTRELCLQITEELQKLGFEINRKTIIVKDVKTVGEYVAVVKLHKEVSAEVPFTVLAEGETAAPAAEEATETPAEAAAETPAEA